MRRFADQTPMMEAPEPPRASRPVNLARESHFQLGALLIRPSLREVQAGARRQIIEPRVMQVLVALARMDGQVVSRDELIEACWGGRIVGEDAINRCIGRLRRLAETFGDSFEIDTVARVGYRIRSPGAEVIAFAPRRPGRCRAPSSWFPRPRSSGTPPSRPTARPSPIPAGPTCRHGRFTCARWLAARPCA